MQHANQIRHGNDDRGPTADRRLGRQLSFARAAVPQRAQKISLAVAVRLREQRFTVTKA